MTNQFRVTGQDLQPNSTILNIRGAKEIAKFTKDGFYYKGEFVDDAGEVHRLLKQALYEMKDPWRLYCERLLRAVDFFDKEAEELVLCQIRTALSGKD